MWYSITKTSIFGTKMSQRVKLCNLAPDFDVTAVINFVVPIQFIFSQGIYPKNFNP